jgi:hypothetical protein
MSFGKLQGLGQQYVQRLGGLDPMNQETATDEQKEAAKLAGRRELFARLSDAFGGRDIGAEAMKRQMFEIERQKLLSPAQRKIIKGADGFNYYADTGERVLPNVTAEEEPEKMDIYSVTDSSGQRVQNIVNPTKEDIAALNEKGYFLNKLPQSATRGEGVDKFPGLSDLQGQFQATNKLVGNITDLAKQFADNPESALALGNVTQFVDSIISNIDAAGNMLQGENYKSVQEKGYVSNQGNDYSNVIKTVSQQTGIAESRVRDLAYLFAAARGQEGRGLSDKDYENALRIVSGGVGAEGKIKVLEDVANRLTKEAYSDLNFTISQLPPELDPTRYNQLQNSIQPFVNPYTNQSAKPLNQADEILKELGF